MKRKLFYINLYFITILCIISFALNYINFSKPVFIVYNHSLYIPAIFDYTYKDFGLSYNLKADYSDEYFNHHLKKNGYAVYLPSYKHNDYIKPLQFPSKQHWLGTTRDGKDLLISVLKSIMYIMIFGIVPSIISLFISLLIGILQGYNGKYYDIFLYRLYEIIISIPFIYVMLFISRLIDLNFIIVCILIGLISWTFLLPYIRNLALQYKNHPAIVSLESMQVPKYKIMYKYLAKIILNKIYPLLGYMFVSNNLAIISISFFNIKYLEDDTIGKLLYVGFQSPFSYEAIFCPLAVFVFFSLSIINICRVLANYD